MEALPVARRFDLDKQRLWLERVRRWQRSKLTIREFCARHHLSEPSFHGWKRVLAERGLLTPGSMTTPQVSTAAGLTAPLFVAATLVDAEEGVQPLEIVLPDGLAVRVSAGFDAATLRRLLALLRGQPC